jgi:hypothetical protein
MSLAGVKRLKPFGLEPCGPEPFGPEPFGPELKAEGLKAEGLKAEGLTAERQSYNALEINRLPRSLQSLAMTKKDRNTVCLGLYSFLVRCGNLCYFRILSSRVMAQKIVVNTLVVNLLDSRRSLSRA